MLIFFYLFGLEAFVAAKRNAFVFHTGAILSKKTFLPAQRYFALEKKVDKSIKLSLLKVARQVGQGHRNVGNPDCDSHLPIVIIFIIINNIFIIVTLTDVEYVKCFTLGRFPSILNNFSVFTLKFKLTPEQGVNLEIMDSRQSFCRHLWRRLKKSEHNPGSAQDWRMSSDLWTPT